ncbi:MAG: bifunctional aspartate kinase/homoserine dehydrogenase I, partial [Pseudomonadota bacterium]
EGLVRKASERDAAYSEELSELEALHTAIAAELLDEATRSRFTEALSKDCRDIADILRAVYLLRSAAANVWDLVCGYGELWSSRLLTGLLSADAHETAPVTLLDARDVLTIELGELGPVVDWPASRANIAARVGEDFHGHVVVPGFIARLADGVQATLGRNGSDYSASIFGALLGADEINIWTDVNGVMSANPNLVADAAVIDALSYNEAMELAYFGAKVLHPQTMGPAVEHSIPIYIRNSFAPEAPGTRIGTEAPGGPSIKGITTVDNVALINVEGAGMIGVPGTAHRVFKSLREGNISVVLISQGSSEHSICFAVPVEHAEAAAERISEAFARELTERQIHSVSIHSPCSILAVVGDAMTGTPGVAAKVFSSLGEAGISVRAIAQGSSERNISAVIDAADARRALLAVHSRFYLSPQTLSIGVIGPGVVGGVLLEQLAGEVHRLAERANVDLRVRGVANSRTMLLEESAVDLRHWRERFDAATAPVDLNAFAQHVQADHLPHAVIIDCSADQGVADRYAGWLASGIHVITPNKRASTSSMDYYRRLQAERRAGEAHYLYETTVGAGLPLLHTLRDLRETGDRILSVQGVFSGTLAYLFNVYDGSRPFSDIVREARASGYTEPDPRDDLSGMDVARKLVIVAREMGLAIELKDVHIQSLVPASLTGGPVDRYLERLHEQDAEMAEVARKAQDEGRVLRYIGRLGEDRSATVKLEALPASHPFARIKLTDNVVEFKTERYHDNPLIVQGPGAGPQVTAAGVFADLLRLAAYLGARL